MHFYYDHCSEFEVAERWSESVVERLSLFKWSSLKSLLLTNSSRDKIFFKALQNKINTISETSQDCSLELSTIQEDDTGFVSIDNSKIKPKVAIVPQEVPVTSDPKLQMTKTKAKKKLVF